MADLIPLRLLVIEDSEADTELELRAVQREGFDVRSERVDNERDLRRVVSELRPQVVLSDFSMPRLDGIYALQLVKELAPGVPFLFISGTIGEERAIEAIRLGATDYVLKDNMRRLGTPRPD
jgi:DNA-binding NtrC family response regulator